MFSFKGNSLISRRNPHHIAASPRAFTVDFPSRWVTTWSSSAIPSRVGPEISDDLRWSQDPRKMGRAVVPSAGQWHILRILSWYCGLQPAIESVQKYHEVFFQVTTRRKVMVKFGFLCGVLWWKKWHLAISVRPWLPPGSEQCHVRGVRGVRGWQRSTPTEPGGGGAGGWLS